MKQSFATLILHVIVVCTGIASVYTENTASRCGTFNGSDLDFPNDGSNFPKKIDCKWTITRKSPFVITFLRFDLTGRNFWKRCVFAYLQVDYSERLCERKIPPPIFVDNAHGTIDVVFRSNTYFSGKGFHMKVKDSDLLYVGSNGTNSRSCGSTRENPCGSIAYVLFHRSSPLVTIKLLSDIVENSSIYINRSAGISILGVGDRNPVVTHLWSETLFDIPDTRGVNFQLKITNIDIIIREMSSLIRTGTHEDATNTFALTMQHVSLKRVRGIGNGKLAEQVLLVFSGYANIIIQDCSFMNFMNITTNQKSTWLMSVRVYIKGFLSIINTVFKNNTFASGLIRFYGGSSLDINLRDSMFVYNSGQLMDFYDTSSLSTNVTDCMFQSNNGNLMSMRKRYSYSLNILLRSCMFENNFGDLISVNTFSYLNFDVKDCVFDSNHGKVLFVSRNRRAVEINMNSAYILNNQVYGEKALIDVQGMAYFNDKYELSFGNVTADNNKGTVLHTTGNRIEVLIKSCAFSNNTTPLQSAAICAQYSKASKLVIEASTFFKNIATVGGAVSSSFHTTIMHSIFYKNEATRGGAVSISGFGVIHKSDFVMNQATIGGAMYLKNEHDSRVNVSVTSCNFTQNTALQHGGAIVTADDTSQITFNVKFSVFIENYATTGGAISSNSYIFIRQSIFNLNRATIGGAIILWARRNVLLQGADKINPDTPKVSAISDTNITTNTNALDTSSPLIIENLYIRHLPEIEQINSLMLFNHDNLFHLLRLAGKITFECGLNQNMDRKTMASTNEYLTESYESPAHVSEPFSRLIVTCNPCPRGLYNTENPVATWKVLSRNRTEIASNNKKAAPKNNSMDDSISKNNCFRCPRGGDCSSGPLKSRVGYWGFRVGDSAEIEFTKCPVGYCSTSPRSYDSCAKNRVGTLCSDCKAGTSLGLFVSSCIDNKVCEYEWFYFMLGFYPCVLIIFITYMIYKDSLKRLFQRLVKQAASAIKSIKALCKCCKSNSEESQIDQEADSDNPSDGSSAMAQVLRILSFYQLQVLLYIPNRLLQEKPISKVWRYVESVLGTVSMLNFIGGGDPSERTENCFPQEFTFISRSLLNIAINLSPIFLSLIILALVCCLERVNGREHPLKLQIQGAIVYLISWFYIPVIKNMFQLVTCVTIVQDGVEISVLFSQASVECYSVWQYAIILFISVYLAWYFLLLYVGTVYLKRNMYKQFHIMACIPITSVGFFLKLQNPRKFEAMGKECGSKRDNHETSESVELELVLTNESAERIESTTEEHISTVNPRQTNDKTTMHCEKLVDIIQAPCRYSYWPSVLFLQKFCVGLMLVIFRSDYSQTLSLMVVLFIYFALLVHKKPYTDRIMNMMEPILLSLLLLLGVLGIINTAYQSSNDDNIHSLLVIVAYLKFVIFLCPFPLWIILIIFNKYSHQKVAEQKEDPACQITRNLHDAASQTNQNVQDGDSQTTQNLKTATSQTTEGQTNLMAKKTDECPTQNINADDQRCAHISTDAKRFMDERVTDTPSHSNDEEQRI